MLTTPSRIIRRKRIGRAASLEQERSQSLFPSSRLRIFVSISRATITTLPCYSPHGGGRACSLYFAASAFLSNQTTPHSSRAHADALAGLLASLSEYNEQGTEMPLEVDDPL